MGSLQVGCVEYINTLPFHLPFKLKKISSSAEFTFAIPAQLNNLLRQNKLDSALTSCIEYLDGDYTLLPGFGMAGQRKILSVNLYTKSAPPSLNGARIGLTHHSATSIALLKVLCHHYWKTKPCFEPLKRNEPFSNYTAFLLIGDEALKKQTIPGFQTIDLGAIWYEMTGLPFVFAVFLFRKKIEANKIAIFQEEMSRALDWSDSNRQIVVKEALKQCPLSPELTHQYFSLLQHRLEEKEMEGLNLFKNLWKSNDV